MKHTALSYAKKELGTNFEAKNDAYFLPLEPHVRNEDLVTMLRK